MVVVLVAVIVGAVDVVAVLPSILVVASGVLHCMAAKPPLQPGL